MKRLRLVFVLLLLVVLLAAGFVWFNLPGKADLADYAPADSLVYVEFNNLAEVAHAIQATDVWKAAAPITRSKPPSENRVLTAAARAGIGPIESVLFARIQVALVVVGLNTIEQDQTLRLRPEIALIAETHTSRWRTKPVMIDVVRRLTNYTFGASQCVGPSGDNDRFECSLPGGDRKLVGVIQGTAIILANSDSALASCLAVRNGTRPSLRTDAEFVQSRASVATQQSLGFAYISSANSGKLFSWAAPLWLGVAPGDQQFQQLLAVSAGKILRGIAWTAVPSGGGIEDRFLFSLEPGVATRLEPAFETSARDENVWKLVPGNFESLTIYRSREPAAAWGSLSSAVAYKLDALPAALFGTLLKSSLSVYGIADPREALTSLSPPLLTMKPSAVADGSVLIARVNDEARLRASLQHQTGNSQPQILQGLQAELDPAKEFTAVFADGYVILGKTENMRACLADLRQSVAGVAEEKKRVEDAARESSAAIVTYANDEARLVNFISTLLMLQGRRLSNDELTQLQNTVRANFASTETRLSAAGIERKTHSAFGQFSTLLGLLQPSGGQQANLYSGRSDSVARRQ
jgi:hypothetical protein